MTKIYTAILAFLCAISVSAQDSYYYYHGEKVQLEIDNTKFVAISSASSNTPLNSSQGFTLLDIIKDDSFKVELYESDSNNTFSEEAFLNIAPETISIAPCFKYHNTPLIPDGYIDVKLKNSKDIALLNEFSKRMHFEIADQNQFMPLWYSLKITPGQGHNPIDIANKLYETHLFASSSPSFMYDMDEISYDPLVHEQWNLYNSSNPNYDISVSEAWNYSTGKDVVIAFVDRGVYLQHPDLKDNAYSKCYDVGLDKEVNTIYNDHGTHCGGIAAAVRNNGNQIAGVAPDAKIMSVSIPIGSNHNINVANGINWAWKNGADIISCSWKTIPKECVEDAIDSALVYGRSGKGCVIVKSAGNEGADGGISYPGNYRPEVLAISSLSHDGSISSFSSHGDNMFVAAPGASILSTMPNGSTAKMSGTSMACPHVSGVAALILSRNPDLSALEVREIIAKSAIKIGTKPYNIMKEFGLWNEYYGYGILNAANAVKNTPKK